MLARRPRIGITSGTRSADWQPGGALWEPYAAAVRAAGGEAIHLDPAVLAQPHLGLDALDGLLLTGGNDVDLRLYPRPPDLGGRDPEAVMRRFAMTWEPERDRYELALAQAALARDLPLLGICRGCQVLHVALGGRLVLDIPQEVATPVTHSSAGRPPRSPSASHAIAFEPGTLLATILPDLAWVNSRHHQAVRAEPEVRVRVAARCPDDGIVEAIEVPGQRWAIGVQWHPERRHDPEVHARCQPLFAAFVAACAHPR